MSNIYIQEPPTSGKVLLKTTAGDIDIELWGRECSLTCRNFIQLCMEGYYNGTIFHRVVKDFIVQGGDPNADGTGGESIYGHTFKDEFHSRLRYARRGLVGMANSGKDDNGSQFFFTMAATPELQNKNTLFGKVTGDTIFNMLKLEEGLVDQNERPMYPQKIIRAEILSNPFPDIQPRCLKKDEKKDKKQKREKGVKNFGLLSFGSEAAGDEEETNDFVHQNSGKAKSLHDVVDDPKLSRTTVKIERDFDTSHEDDLLPDDGAIKEENESHNERMQRIQNKFKSKSSIVRKTNARQESNAKIEIKSDSDEDVLMTQAQEKKIESEKKKEEIRLEILALKKQYQTDKKIKDERLEKKTDEKKPEKDLSKSAEGNEFIKNFIEEKVKYSHLKKQLPPKGASRESFTLNLLSKFRDKLDALKDKQDDTEDSIVSTTLDESVVEQEIKNDDWLSHTLKFEEPPPILAKDASTKSDDWYDAYDPRNPLNKRKRGADSSGSKSRHVTKKHNK